MTHLVVCVMLIKKGAKMKLVINTLAHEYTNFHDAVIESVYYDVNNKLIEITLDALNFYYDGESKREELKVVFENVKNVKITEVFYTPMQFLKRLKYLMVNFFLLRIIIFG